MTQPVRADAGRIGPAAIVTLGPMDIGAFYDRDPRRRGSEELLLGRDWLDADGDRWRVAWLRDTGELFAMLQPAPTMPTGGILMGSTGTSGPAPLHSGDLTVFVLAELHQESEVRGLTRGWEEKQGRPDSFEWLIRRLDAAGHPPPWTRDDQLGDTGERGLRAWIKRHFDM